MAGAPRGRIILWGVELAAVFGLVLGPLIDRAETISAERSLLVLLLVPAHLERLLAIVGRVPRPRISLLAVELAAVAIACFEREPILSLRVAAVVTLVLASHARPKLGHEGSPATQVVSFASLAITALSLVQNLMRQTQHAEVRLLCFAAIAIAPFWPRRARSDAAALRTIAACFAMLSVSLSTKADPIYAVLDRALIATSTLAVSGDLAFLYLAIVSIIYIDSERAMHSNPSARRRELASRLVLLVATFFVFVGLGELAFKIVPTRYPGLVTSFNGFFRPNRAVLYDGPMLARHYEDGVLVQFNRRGWHDREHDFQKPEDTVRVLVIGDGPTEGAQVPFDSMFHRRLEALLAEKSDGVSVEVIAIARESFGPIEELAVLEKEGLAYDPDLVLLQFSAISDVLESQQDLANLVRRTQQATLFRLFVRALREHAFFQALIFERLWSASHMIDGTFDPVQLDAYRSEPKARRGEWQLAWRLAAQTLSQMRALLEERGAQFAVVAFASPLEVRGTALEGVDPRLPSTRMSGAMDALQIPYLDLADRLRALPEPRRRALFIENDGCLASVGHEEAAAATARFLLESALWESALNRALRSSRAHR